MELIREDAEDAIYFFTDGRHQKNYNWAISVDKEDIPDDFDPARTARMIERIERLEEFAKNIVWLKQTDNLSQIYDKRKSLISGIKEDLDYIENGDKEEMVEVSILPTVHNSKVLPFQSGVNFTKIPKSEAIRLKIIKE